MPSTFCCLAKQTDDGIAGDHTLKMKDNSTASDSWSPFIWSCLCVSYRSLIKYILDYFADPESDRNTGSTVFSIPIPIFSKVYWPQRKRLQHNTNLIQKEYFISVKYNVTCVNMFRLYSSTVFSCVGFIGDKVFEVFEERWPGSQADANSTRTDSNTRLGE